MSIVKRKIKVPESIDPKKIVTLKAMGNIQEISISERQNSGATIKPLSKESFVVLSTGEFKKVEHHAADRTENIRNLQKSFHALGDIINSNICPENVHCCRFVTLTYKENVTNPDQLYQDFRRFNQRLKRFMKRQGFHYEYIISVEAQKRGSLHLHCILIFDSKAPFIDNATLAEIWGLGFVSIKSIDKNVDNIGKYLTAYLTDLPIDNDTDITSDMVGGEIKEIETEGQSKRVIKGARLKLLPAGMRIYRYSRGIKKPVLTDTTYEEAVDFLSDNGYSKVAEYAVEISDTDRNFKNRYVKETYKKFINKQGVENNDT